MRATTGEAAPRRARLRGRLLRRYVQAHPVAFGFAALILVTSVATGSLWGADASFWGTGPLAVFADGRWWTPLTVAAVPDSTIDTVLALLLSVTVLAYAEAVLGHRRTIWVMLCTTLVGVGVSIGIHAGLWVVTELGPVEIDEMPVLDPAIAVVGAAMTATAFSSALWRRRIRFIGFAVLLMFALYAGDVDAWYRLAVALVGLVLGMVLARGRERHPWHRSSVRETRSLMAALVAVTGFGPFAALVGGGGRGPLSLVVSSFAEFNQHLIDTCAVTYTPRCDHQLALLVTHGAGPTALALVPLVLLLVAALGLRQGRRAGLVLAVAVETLLAGLAVYSLLSGELYIDRWVDGSGLQYVMWGIASIGVPLAAAVSLVVLRRRFPVRATSRAVRAFAGAVALAFVLCAALFVAASWTERASFDVLPSLGDILVEMIRRFVPPAFLQGVGQPPYPRRGVALFIYQWVGVAFWCVVVVGMLRLYRRVRSGAHADAALYRDLLRRGGGTLGFIGTWHGNSYWYSEDRQSAVAYRLVGDVAIAIADPLTVPAHRARTVGGFVDHCISHGWTPVFYSIHDEFLPVFEQMGWEHTSVGEETVMVLADLTMTGKAWQKVRQPMTRAEREGIVDVWTRWQDLTAAQISQIEEIDEQWVADRALPEMGFTLGSLEEAKDPEVALLLAVDAEGRIQVVTSWMPSWCDGRLTGWTLDFMRRRPDGPNGLMEFVIARAALRAKDDGLTELSLSGAPLATKPDGPGSQTVLAALLEQLAEVLEPVYGFASLFRFKSKFHPEYRTIHLAYGDPMQLPLIGVAIGRAYLPDADARDVWGVARAARGSER
ncbi:bifunctional lysylphosphatidylglycerol flippase/synthetase MprF [Microbacterium sp. SORGH_AS_0888]|uniref:bifunctional lysylphosphatidylglycerol flippase/synthetase MprF n=1 Tax=Microbacterium sp. SORGH_AS_0888 TaxID=3041791 RepID=UPI002781C0C2|nr:DUF2156 domain-containing protein [Microbacterium sp. SORGH_AS_0888]MDQ1127948.1 lysylphosphatidylglycerol synthetase-like protein (DUF2156 family) [Microbacterium sp. SORGH_AS_0888]